MVGLKSTLDKSNSIQQKFDTSDVPSAAWGWSGEAPRTFRAAGWIVALFLLAMIIGNHTGRVEDLYLIGFAVLIAAILILDIVRRKRNT